MTMQDNPTALNVLEHLARTDKPFQLVKHIDDVPTDKLIFPMWGEKKYDGVFCAVVLDAVDHYAVSRTGKKFFHPINEVIYPFVPKTSAGYVVIGELINKRCSLEVLSGLVNPNRIKDWSVEEKELMRSCDYILHDVLSFPEVIAGFSVLPFQHRRNVRLCKLSLSCYLAEGRMLHSQADFDEYAAEEIAKGEEGIVGKNLQAGYEAGHKGWRVVKKVRDLHVDLKCLAVETGKGKRTGQIARLQFKYKGKLFWADLGEGWTDEKRIQLTENWKLQRDWPYECSLDTFCPIGKIFHLKALQESSKGVLRLPKVQELRIDKFVEDVT